MEIHNWVMEVQKSIAFMDMQNSSLWISMIGIMDIHVYSWRSMNNHRHPELELWRPTINWWNLINQLWRSIRQVSYMNLHIWIMHHRDYWIMDLHNWITEIYNWSWISMVMGFSPCFQPHHIFVPLKTPLTRNKHPEIGLFPTPI